MNTKPNQFRSLIAASGQAPIAQTTSATPAERPLAKSRRTGKRTAPDYVQVGVYIPKKLHAQAKVLLINEETERDFSQLMGDLLSDYLHKRLSS